MQKDSVLRGTPIPLFYKADTGLTVEAYVQHPDFPGEATMLSLTELPTASGHIKVYVAAFTPNELGWYHVTFKGSLGDTTLTTDATRFYSYAEGENGAQSVGEAVSQELSVKVGSPANIVYRGLSGLTVSAKAVHESELQTPEVGVALSLVEKPAPAGYKSAYIASFTPTRTGKFFVYIKTSADGGDALTVVNAFSVLPYSRSAGSIKSTATSTVL